MKQTFLCVKQKFAEFKVLKQPTIERYTNGSKDGNKIASAAVVNINIVSVRLPDEATIFTVEAKAIVLALKYTAIEK